MPCIFRAWPLEKLWAKVFWQHSLTAFAEPGSVPTGFGIFDFAQPLFVFVTGVSASLAFQKFTSADGLVDARAFWKRLLQRTLMLWFLGSLIRGLLTFNLFTGPDTAPNFVFYSDTLHTIAVAYCAASVGLLLMRKWWARLAVALGLIAAAAVVMACCGDYSRYGNAARLFENFVYGKMGGSAKDFCYLLTTLTWAGMGILASLFGDVLKGALAPWTKVKLLSAAGVACMALGGVLSIWVPPIRYIYTVSFVFLTQGLSLLMLAALYAMTDIGNVRKGTWLLILFGKCSLAAWLIVNYFGGSVDAAARNLVTGVPKLLGTNAYHPLFVGIARMVIIVVLVWMWSIFRRNVRKAKN